MKDALRQRVAAQQTNERGKHPQAQSLEEEDLHNRGAPGADQAQIGDRPASLGRRQKQRIECEQQPQQRADRSEEPACLIAGIKRLAQFGDVLVCRRDREPRLGERLQFAARGCLLTGLGHHQDARDPARQPCKSLQVPQGHDGHPRLRERAERFLAQHRRDAQRGRMPAQQQRHPWRRRPCRPLSGRRGGGRDRPGGNSDRFGARAAETEPPRREGRDRERVGESVEQHEARVGARQVDRDALPIWPHQRRGLFQQRRCLPDCGQAFDAREQAFIEAVGAASAELQARWTRHRAGHFARRAGDGGADEHRSEHKRHGDRHP
jgi:hypothetical protein